MNNTTEIIIQGRPDFADHSFGRTRAKRHPKYVYSSTMGLLMHEIAYVELHWYTVGDHGHSLIRLNHPRITIATRCGQHFFTNKSFRGKERSTVCELPKPDTVLCGRCRGEGAIFPKRGKWNIQKREAKARLGCVDVVQV